MTPPADLATLPLPSGSPFPSRARRALALLGGVGALGLLSGLWLYVDYNFRAWSAGRAPLVSFGDAVGSGVMDWGLWVLFLPFALRTVRRFPLERARIARALAGHAAAAVLISIGQLALFALLSVAVRALLYEQDPAWSRAEIVREALASAFRAKFETGLLLSLFVLAVLHARESWLGLRDRPPRLQLVTDTAPVQAPAPPPAAPAPLCAEPEEDRLVASAGGRVALLRFEEIDRVEAAGNYLRIHCAGRVHLSRGTLAGFLERARGRGFVRVHRSTLVRAACIASLTAVGSGDLELELRDGTHVRASRRYRAALDEVLAALDEVRNAARPAPAASRPGEGNAPG